MLASFGEFFGLNHSLKLVPYMVFLNLVKIAIGNGVLFCFVSCTGLKWGYILGVAISHSLWELMVGKCPR